MWKNKENKEIRRRNKKGHKKEKEKWKKKKSGSSAYMLKGVILGAHSLIINVRHALFLFSLAFL